MEIIGMWSDYAASRLDLLNTLFPKDMVDVRDIQDGEYVEVIDSAVFGCGTSVEVGMILPVTKVDLDDNTLQVAERTWGHLGLAYKYVGKVED